MSLQQMSDIDLKGKRVLIREDLNVPLQDGKITSDIRIRAALPTIQQALSAGAAVILMSHLGRPKEGVREPALSLAPVAERLAELLQQPVRLHTAELSHTVALESGDVVLLENVRFSKGEKADDPELAAQLAELCDVFVMDAFATAHRAQASTHGVAKYAPIACAGPLLIQELAALKRGLANPQRPLLAIVAGAKVSTKLTVLESLSQKVDQLIVGGGIANTFLAAKQLPVGKSLYEPDLVDSAQRLLELAKQGGASIPLPSDVVVANEFSASAHASVKAVSDVGADDMILDIGPNTAKSYAQLIANAGTILWNGPVGVFEFDQFGAGTQAIAEAVAQSSGFSIAGGGDTLAAIEKYKIADKLAYISTGGGAFLEYLEGKTLPAIAILEERGM